MLSLEASLSRAQKVIKILEFALRQHIISINTNFLCDVNTWISCMKTADWDEMCMIVRINFIMNFLVAKPKILHELLLLRSQFRTLLSMPLLDIKIIYWKAHRNCSKSDISACIQYSYILIPLCCICLRSSQNHFPNRLEVIVRWWANELSIILHL